MQYRRTAPAPEAGWREKPGANPPDSAIREQAFRSADDAGYRIIDRAFGACAGGKFMAATAILPGQSIHRNIPL